MTRALALRKETLRELTDTELDAVAGAKPRTLEGCVAATLSACAPSQYFISFCGCLSNYCSIDVC